MAWVYVRKLKTASIEFMRNMPRANGRKLIYAALVWVPRAFQLKQQPKQAHDIRFPIFLTLCAKLVYNNNRVANWRQTITKNSTVKVCWMTKQAPDVLAKFGGQQEQSNTWTYIYGIRHKGTCQMGCNPIVLTRCPICSHPQPSSHMIYWVQLFLAALQNNNKQKRKHKAQN